MFARARLAILLSGEGTTAEAVINACRQGELPAETVLVIANKISAGGLKKAEALNVPTKVIGLIAEFGGDEEAFGEAILAACRQSKVDVIGQYGWLAYTPQNVVEAYQGRIINQHPGPLDPGYPDFGGQGMYGKRVHCARILFCRGLNKDHWTEATAQLVAVEYDKGDLLLTERVAIEKTDDVDTLQQRVLPVEHRVQIQALRGLVEETAAPFQRSSRLVKSGEEQVLKEARSTAILLYP